MSGRLPDGTGLSSLRDEAAKASSPKASIPSADGSNWTRKTVAIWEAWSFGEYYAYKRDFYGPWHLRTKRGDIFTSRSLQDVIEHAHAHATEPQDICPVCNGCGFQNPQACDWACETCGGSGGVPAQAIEARRAETHSGSVHESAVPKECAQ